MKRKIVEIEAPSLLSGDVYAKLSAALDEAIVASLLYQKSSGTSFSATAPIP